MENEKQNESVPLMDSETPIVTLAVEKTFLDKVKKNILVGDRFLGICLVIASVIMSSTWLYTTQFQGATTEVASAKTIAELETPKD